jgi:hypothetical protein
MAELRRAWRRSRVSRSADIGLAISRGSGPAGALARSSPGCRRPDLADWDGLGFVVQCYQKRARPTIDWLAPRGSTGAG